MLRPFDWRDLLKLYRYRHQSIYLNNALMATRAPELIPSVLLSYLSPSMGRFTWIMSDLYDNAIPLIGQFTHAEASHTALLAFLTPKNALDSSRTPKLITLLAKQAGQRGAFHLLADVEEDTTIFEILRKVGFSVSAHQRVWQWNRKLPDSHRDYNWKTTRPVDIIPLRSLYRKTIPKPIIQIEPLQTTPLKGLVYYRETQAMGYAKIKYGHGGIWVQPCFHPDMDDVNSIIIDLLNSIPERRARPLYLCVRDYQPNLEPALNALEWIPSPKQVFMVKHLVARHKIITDFKIPNLNGQPEASIPITQSKRNT
ncbi:MAG: hypothetical protein U9Q82_01925 [Chloroflexota bacterium]|nr:hypothetical protein [Chloroflexota bacterium]